MPHVSLCIENVRTKIYGCTPDLLEEIDKVTSFLASENLGIEKKRYNVDDVDFAWDGWTRFLDRTEDPPSIPSGLRDLVINKLQSLGVSLSVQDFRIPPQISLNPRFPTCPIKLWDHQIECNKAMQQNGDVVARMPPRAGKTKTLLETVRALDLDTIWIAPTNSIVTQTVKEAEKWFGEEAVHVSKANWEEHRDKLLLVCTAGGAMTLPTEFWQTRKMLVVDEGHHFLANKSWGKYLLQQTPHIFHRKSMSGTFFRSNGDDLALLAYCGRIGYSISSQTLLDKGLLVPTYQVFVPIEGPKIHAKKGEWFSEHGHGTLGIATHGHRCDVIAAIARHLEALGRTVVIIVTTKQQGYLIRDRLEAYYPKKSNVELQKVEFVSTDRPKPVIQKVYSSFVGHEEVRILIGTSMVGEGLDLPPADALIYAAGGKAAVTYTQALYRVCTAHEGKKFGVVVDFIDRHHRSLLEHSRARWKVASSDPVFRLSMLDSVSDFPQWAANTQVV